MEWLGPTLKPYDLLPRDAGGAVAPKPAAATAAPSEFTFDDALDIVNPLQHFPVVGTVYRAITHDQIKTPEKIIGDTLFGGLWGLVSSVADAVFEAATGHNFGDTVMALVTGKDNATPKPAIGIEEPVKATEQAVQPAPAADAEQAGDTALSASLSRAGVDEDTAQRALYAYRRATGLSASAVSPF